MRVAQKAPLFNSKFDSNDPHNKYFDRLNENDEDTKDEERKRA